MSNGPACACLRVKYDPLDNGDGTMSERWRCEDCKTVFVKQFWLSEANRKLREFEKFAFEAGEGAGGILARMQDAESKLSVERERDEARKLYRREYDIVKRIWEQLGLPSYDDLKGRSIHDLIQEIIDSNAEKSLRLDASLDMLGRWQTAFAFLIDVRNPDPFEELHKMDDETTEFRARAVDRREICDCEHEGICKYGVKDPRCGRNWDAEDAAAPDRHAHEWSDWTDDEYEQFRGCECGAVESRLVPDKPRHICGQIGFDTQKGDVCLACVSERQ